MKTHISISKIIALATIVAGVMHGWEAFEHRTMIPHLLLFTIGGVVQLWLGWQWWREEKPALPIAAVNGGFALMWLATRFFLPPFLTAPETFSALGWTLFCLEMGTLILLPRLLQNIFVGVVVALAVYGSGVIGQQIMPELIANHAHGGHHH